MTVLDHSGDERFRYQLLSRMQNDCMYYLGAGGRCDKHLWAGNPCDQIDTMYALWDEFPDDSKPDWLSREQISEYAVAMGSV